MKTLLKTCTIIAAGGLLAPYAMELVPIGHWSSRFAEGARCTIFTAQQGAFRGSILPLKASGHTFNEEVDTQPVAWTQVELRPDVVAECAGDLAATGFDIGDFVAIDPQTEFLDNGFIVSRHLDDKAGVAAMITTPSERFTSCSWSKTSRCTNLRPASES